MARLYSSFEATTDAMQRCNFRRAFNHERPFVFIHKLDPFYKFVTTARGRPRRNTSERRGRNMKNPFRFTDSRKTEAEGRIFTSGNFWNSANYCSFKGSACHISAGKPCDGSGIGLFFILTSDPLLFGFMQKIFYQRPV